MSLANIAHSGSMTSERKQFIMNKASQRSLLKGELDLLVMKGSIGLIFNNGNWWLGSLKEAMVDGDNVRLRFIPRVSIRRGGGLINMFQPSHRLICQSDKADQNTLRPDSQALLFEKPRVDVQLTTNGTMVLKPEKDNGDYFLVLSTNPIDIKAFNALICPSKLQGTDDSD